MLLILSLLFAVAPAFADHAISRYGATAYSEDFTHFHYVNPKAPKGGLLRQAVVGSFDTIMPFNGVGVPAAETLLLYGTLMTRSQDEPLSKYGWIAQSVDYEPKQRRVTFTLNPKARFSDGSPITCSDVQYSYETFRDQGAPFYQLFFQQMQAMHCLDERRARFLFNNDDPELPVVLGQMPILSKAHWQQRDFRKPGLTPPVSSGPYVITDLQPGRSITYQRIDNYWAAQLPVNQGRFNIDRLQFDYFLNDASAIEALKKGEIDLTIMSASPTTSSDEMTHLLAQPHLTVSRFDNHNPQVQSLVLNTRHKALSNPLIREAITSLIDVEAINHRQFHGTLSAAPSLFAGSELASPTLALSPLSPRHRKARTVALLQQAGAFYRKGKLYFADGSPFTLEVIANDPMLNRLLLPIADQLRAVGIELSVRQLDNAQFKQRLQDKAFELTLYTFKHTPAPGIEQQLFWHSATAKAAGSRNLTGAQFADVDATLAQLPHITQWPQLLRCIQTLDQQLHDHHIAKPLWYSKQWQVVHQPHIKAPPPSPLFALDLHSWWVEP